METKLLYKHDTVFNACAVDYTYERNGILVNEMN